MSNLHCIFRYPAGGHQFYPYGEYNLYCIEVYVLHDYIQYDFAINCVEKRASALGKTNSGALLQMQIFECEQQVSERHIRRITNEKLPLNLLNLFHHTFLTTSKKLNKPLTALCTLLQLSKI
jgi:hypothetical protein